MTSREIAALEELKSLFTNERTVSMAEKWGFTAPQILIKRPVNKEVIVKGIYLQIRDCENGFIVSNGIGVHHGGPPAKEYVAGDEKELAKLVEKLAKDSKEPAKK